ncbi:SNF2 family N-terminal domain protein [Treponema vincentii ATCC 35580]|uniref:SNF2 family N-terminal domain protein n=2 Tax=Treponema vincentii TaxID=69710 RepID=C8PNE8_9SPIR|nr:SNF2 family N-terminal domain protein [Treponema vincentii ATCC 35580]
MTPWGAWFLRMIESYDGDGRVSRGKSYANTGKVDSLVITGNKVAARVAGRYDPWYYISLTFPRISEPNRKKLEKILTEHPADFIALGSGTMTDRLVALFEAKDIRFIPRRWSLIESDCSCPDSASLCKHIAAVLYILAKEIDHDPRLLFQLAGIDLAELREKILPAAGDMSAEPALTVVPEQGASPTAGTAVVETPNADTVAAGGTIAGQVSDTALETPATGDATTVGAQRKARQSGAAGTAANVSPLAMPSEPEYEHPVPLSLRRSDEPALDVPAELPRFPLEESFLPLISALLPPLTPFYDDDLVAAFKELYHKLIVRQNKEFELALEQRIAVLMKSGTGCASAATLCDSSRLLYTPVRLDTAKLPTQKTAGGPAFPLQKEAALQLRVRLPNGTEAALTLVQALHLLRGVTPAADSPDGMKAAYTVLTLGERLVAESALLPAVYLDPVTRRLAIFWKPLTSAQAVSAAIDRCASFITEAFFPQIKSWGRRYCAELLLTAFLTEYVHTTGFIPAGIRQAEQEIAALFFQGATINTKAPGMRRLPASISRWLAALYYDSNSLRFRLILAEAKQSDFEISAEVCHSEETNNQFVPFSRIADSVQLESKTVEFAIALSAYLPKLTEMIGQKSVPLTQEETAVFLRTAAPLLSRFGIEVVLPKTLQRALKPRAVFQLKRQKGAGAVQSYLNLDNLMDYDRSIMLGDTVISAKKFRALMKQSSGLVRFNDRYILVDPEHTARLLETMQHERPGINEVIQGTLTGDTVMADGAPFSYSLFRETNAAVPQTLQATLRPYQEKGFQWLYSTIKSGFGCLLGDDMGLGKTLQVIALILKLKEQGFEHSGILIAAPASLLPNWEHELHTFAPSLRCTILHGQGRRFSAKSDIHITTYQTLQRDVKKLSEKIFDCLIIDEAQAVKNTQTKNAQALRLVQAQSRIAMTGTPVENSLEDMRALFDFIIPGYLGSAESFRKKWRIPIELHGDAETAESFQKITAPFLLRRLKTDPAVISDLPEKVITPQYCRLTPEQIALYESLVETQLKNVLKTEEGIKRNALVLKLLTALKQVCNHPHVYDESFQTNVTLSGKTAALMQLLGEILDAGEKTLIFSQYTQTLFLLRKLIQEQFGDEPLLLHGQMPLSARKAAVESFQTNPAQRIFLISLKAGGTGLNLTAATRVIHFDLWYNPAIEDQATDRAFRIGQHNTVFVSRFICAGTFEEKIDEMIQKKRHISQMTLSGGESWIGKMSNEELAELFQ